MQRKSASVSVVFPLPVRPTAVWRQQMQRNRTISEPRTDADAFAGADMEGNLIQDDGAILLAVLDNASQSGRTVRTDE
jgi:hypothetical protein